MEKGKRVKNKDNHYDYINIDAVALHSFHALFYAFRENEEKTNVTLTFRAFNFLDSLLYS
jgi:hypothetical protein